RWGAGADRAADPRRSKAAGEQGDAGPRRRNRVAGPSAEARPPESRVPRMKRLGSLAEAHAALAALDLDRVKSRGPWSVGDVFAHCAQSIEYAMTGFPILKPWLFQATIGKIALGKFLRQGYMSHAPDAAIPGAPAPEASDARAGLARLKKAIKAFQA